MEISEQYNNREYFGLNIHAKFSLRDKWNNFPPTYLTVSDVGLKYE